MFVCFINLVIFKYFLEFLWVNILYKKLIKWNYSIEYGWGSVFGVGCGVFGLNVKELYS